MFLSTVAFGIYVGGAWYGNTCRVLGRRGPVSTAAAARRLAGLSGRSQVPVRALGAGARGGSDRRVKLEARKNGSGPDPGIEPPEPVNYVKVLPMGPGSRVEFGEKWGRKRTKLTGFPQTADNC